MKIKNKELFLESLFGSRNFNIDLNLFRHDLSQDVESYQTAKSYLYENLEFKKISAEDNPNREWKATLGKEKLKNDNHYYVENQVFNSDAIPLEVYRKMSYDPTISLAMRLIIGMASSLKWNIEASDAKTEAVCRFAIDNVYREMLRNTINISYRYGWFFAEKVWARKETTLYGVNESGEKKKIFSGFVIYPKKIKGLDPQNRFKFYKDVIQDEIVKVAQQQNFTSTTGEYLYQDVEIKREKIFWFALDKEFSNVFGRSRFKGAYKYWYHQNLSEGYMSSNMASGTQNTVVSRYPAGSTPIRDSYGQSIENADIGFENLKDAYDGAGLNLPSTRDDKGNYLWDLEFKNAPITDLEKYTPVLNHFMKMILMVMGVPTGILDGDNNASELDAKIDLFFLIFEELLLQLEEVIQKELLDWIVQYNFGPKSISTTKFKFDRNGLGRRNMMKEILINMLRVATRPNSQPKNLPDIREICDDLGIPTSSYSDQFMKDPFAIDPMAQPAADGAKDATRQADQNGVDRVNKTTKESERPTKQKSVTGGSR